jgi:hypothetical protein|tara:strand:- start:260 stop:481 length:222 start_codon:yes stop_codon:yes gene_type:complete
MIIKNWNEMTKDQKRAAKEFVKSQIGRVSPQSEQIPPNARSINKVGFDFWMTTRRWVFDGWRVSSISKTDWNK